jgi:hypothetical protein
MATADDVSAELMGTNPPPGHHATVMFENGPAGFPYTAYSMQDKLSHASHEVTLFLPARTVADLVSRRGKNDTTLGHAINAASYGDKIWQALQLIAAKAGVDLSGIQ